jgi:hypothetical protein
MEGGVTRSSLVDPAVLAELCAELRALLDAELAAGNKVDETSRDYPLAVNVWLRGPFRVTLRKLPAHVSFRKVNDPHYWLAEYECSAHKQLLACKYR